MRRVALALELVLYLALVVLLGVAAYKLLRILQRLDVGWARRVPFLLVFAGAAFLAGRQVLLRIRQLRRGENGGVSRHDR